MLKNILFSRSILVPQKPPEVYRSSVIRVDSEPKAEFKRIVNVSDETIDKQIKTEVQIFLDTIRG